MGILRKTVFLVLICLIAAGTLMAGGGGQREPAAGGGGKTVVKLWTQERHSLSFMQVWWDRYNATNKDNIEFVQEIYTDNYPQMINLAFQSGEVPDICNNGNDVLIQYISQNKWVDLLPLMTAEQKETFAACMLEGNSLFDGKLYSIPPMATANRLFYNKGIFRRVGVEPPKTLEEMVVTARKITDTLKGEGIYGFAQNMKSPISGLERSFKPMAMRQLGNYEGYDFAKGEYDFSGYAPILLAWRELLSPAIAFPGSESLDIDPLRAQFAAGKIAMYMSWTHAEPGVYASQFPTNEEWGAVQIPVAGGNVKGAQYYNSTAGVMILSESKVIPAAWKVVSDIFCNLDLLKGYYEEGLGITVVPKVIAVANPAPVFRDNPDMLITPTDKMWPNAPHREDATAVVVEGLNMWDAFMQVIYANADAERTMADLSARYNRAYQAAIQQGLLKPIRNPNFNPMDPRL